MYRRILVALDNSATDQALLPHIAALAQLHHAELFLLHVATGWAAHHYERFQLTDSEEMKEDRAYLEETADKLRAEGLKVQTHLGLGGDPAHGILQYAREENCDLIAMTTHGHRLLKDLFYGSTITRVRHRAHVPVLLVNAK